jgi:predicted kinase
MSGLPGVGKDTYVRRHLAHLPCVSLDDIRAEIGVSPSDNQEPVLAVARERARQYLRHGESMVWNATNLSRELRTRRLSFADDYGARVRLIYVEVPAAVQRSQNKNRPARVPDNAMERIFRQWEMPDLTEAHTLEFAVRDAGEK